MTILRPHIMNRAFNTPLMLDARKGAMIANIIGSRAFGGDIRVVGPEPVDHVAGGRQLMGRLGDPLGRDYADDVLRNVIDGVAIIAIEGTLIHKGKWLDSYSGDTSYEGIQAQVMRARKDPAIKGVVLEVDSYGGEVAGAFDTAEMIAELAAEKPCIAILTDVALSAGYLMAAPTRAIILPETGWAGSIGVVVLHVDFSRSLEDDGIKVTPFTREGSQVQSLSRPPAKSTA